MVLKQRECEIDDRLCFIRAFRFECLENLPALLRQERPCQPSSVTSFNYWEPNLSWNALNFFTLYGGQTVV